MQDESSSGNHLNKSAFDREQALISECLEFKHILGVHHFSGSWLGLDGSKSGWLKDEVRLNCCLSGVGEELAGCLPCLLKNQNTQEVNTFPHIKLFGSLFAKCFLLVAYHLSHSWTHTIVIAARPITYISI